MEGVKSKQTLKVFLQSHLYAINCVMMTVLEKVVSHLSYSKCAKLKIKQGINYLYSKSQCGYIFNEKSWQIQDPALHINCTYIVCASSCFLCCSHPKCLDESRGHSNTWSVFGSLTAQEHLHKTPITHTHKNSHGLQYITTSKLDWWGM